ncbi:MAG TPA: DUF2971 domain-containing protein [Bryobacteraceae bacterium]|nr:DUF2971 domain-containing protein [Bryobacteraceae bacterium]
MRRAADSAITCLYHYEAFNRDRLKDTLINQRVHFSSPQHFNDPWDCHPWFDATEVLDPVLRSKWVRFLERHLTADQEQTLAAKYFVWQEDIPFLQRTIGHMIDSIWQLNADRWRMYCLTPHPTSVLMWSHYGDKHRGLCLEFDATAAVIGRALQVRYQENLPAISASSFDDWGAIAPSILLDKSIVWAYEDEYRVLARDSKADALPTDFLPVTGKDFLPLPVGALTAVIAGCNADLDAVTSIVQAHAPSIRVQRCVRAHNKYALSIEA